MKQENASLESALAALYRRRTFGIKPGLDVTRRLLACLDNPQDSLRIVHVAGTVGKGAVCTMVESVLRGAGAHTGLFTSPHLIQFNERIRVDGVPIADAVLRDLIREVDTAALQVSDACGMEVTFFEFATALALLHFRRCGVNWVILETGLGGRLDATNVVLPLLTVITRVGFDHMQYLGDSLDEIACEKAGIIKPGVPVILGPMAEAARSRIQAVAGERTSGCLEAEALVTVSCVNVETDCQHLVLETQAHRYGRVRLPLGGAYQVENLVTAIAAIECLRLSGALGCEDDAVRRGIEMVQWPGRFQQVGEDPVIIVDGAHNEDGARALAQSLRRHAKGRTVGFVVGFSADKDVDAVMRCLRPLGGKAWVVGIQRDSGADVDVVCSRLAGLGFEATGGLLADVMEAARRWATAETAIVCVTGSLYLVGEYLAALEGREKDNLTEI